MMRKIWEELVKSMKTSSYRMTEQRRKILQILESVPGGHPSAGQVFDAIVSSDSNVSISTVYNTLNFLTRLGIIKVIEFESSENRYELNLEPHVNLICRKCGAIQDYPQDTLPPQTCGNNGGTFKVSDFRFEYYGTCKDCEGESSTSASGKHVTVEAPCSALAGTP
ncbi:Fur family transcriptional regulator [Candidatus Moduliflexota bacterium]